MVLEEFNKDNSCKISLPAFKKKCYSLLNSSKKKAAAKKATRTNRKRHIRASRRAKKGQSVLPGLPAPAEKPAFLRSVQITIAVEGVDVREDGKGRHTTMKKLAMFIAGH